MNNYSLWSLRLGYTNNQAHKIESLGIENFVKKSIDEKFSSDIPPFLKNSPKNIKEFKNQKKYNKAEELIKIQKWWIDKMRTENYPLREKMVCFLHNHFVASSNKVTINRWIFEHNSILRTNAFGNLKDLCKKILKCNATLDYLDNNTNRKNNLNENLSRELLELFTLGLNNYTEKDVQSGAKALAGLSFGDIYGVYNHKYECNEKINYLNHTGVFKLDDLIDIIFKHPKCPYLFTKKILNWFIYDNPTEELIIYYGNYLKYVNFELRPFLIKLFTEEFNKETAGSKIKDPLLYAIQLLDELKLSNSDSKFIVNFIKNQGMPLLMHKSVKGWKGGKEWLSTQILFNRNKIANQLCKGENNTLYKINLNQTNIKINERIPNIKRKPNCNYSCIKTELCDKLIFSIDENLQKNIDQIIKHDFDPKAKNSDRTILRLFNYLVTTPEYQLL
ncbi:DUF1800 family protein [Urechidicola croceus]|uniref:DUF1800 domain-containing protein n=1 Tax=Urechidicola croceus TaxID=1850246 RepID=A0A1D8P5R8_9FLAO|nr:DUF1800 family protein [Urechidicola croceus]AOW19932.1 hypothetical protein LPB138_04200 [Urechidicola croceus]